MLGDLEVAPADRQVARQVADRLDALDQAGRQPDGRAVKKVFQIALGIIAAIGGYVDIGDLVFNVQAGARFGYQLLWAIPLGVVGIMVFAEMSGRVAAVAKKANFELVKERYGPRLALADARRVAGADLPDAGRRARRCGPGADAVLRRPGADVHVHRGGRAGVGLLVLVLRRDRADLRLRRARAARLRRRRRALRARLGAAGRRLGSDGAGLDALLVLRGRSGRGGLHAVRDLLLFVGGARGGLDGEGSRGQPGQRGHRLRARRIAGGRPPGDRGPGVQPAGDRPEPAGRRRPRRRRTPSARPGW